MNSQSGAAMAGAPSYRPQTGADGRAENFVQIIDVVKKFGETVAVRNVELSVRKGELFALLGSSGCGSRRCCACSPASRRSRRARS